ncbi:cytochrome P450 [Mycolicibacterium sp. BK634]|uniref:cytochrome P450 n=1 Tax=Mycolicibacterium sp. BK634 TaxID=2587099 RepID=UPI00161D6A88|nr:cytochrome P450 [Mycolicibacterium sp. BK634]MBB3753666.1 cytochrome P450 [Mycolicibacterium sp. BK634]
MTTPEVSTSQLPWDAADPYPLYEAYRREGDVVWDATAQAWLVLGYHAAREVLVGQQWTSDPRANQAVAAYRLFTAEIVQTNMLFTDGPTHDRLRHAVRDVFSRSFISQLTEGIESLCKQTVSAIDVDEPFDVMSQIAWPLPVVVVAAWLGLDPAQCQVLREYSPAVIRLLSGITDTDTLHEGLAASTALITEFLPAAADRRVNPGDDLLSYLATAPELSLDEVVTTAILIAVAGHETTANLLGAALTRLLTPTAEDTRLADHIDPADPTVLSELLRLDSPVQAAARTATADHHLANVHIRNGESVLVCIAAANRDPHLYPAPNQFLPDRHGPPPLTFGHGPHYCLGATLARLETSTALRHILARRPVLTDTPTWRDTPAIRGPQHMPARFTV